MALERLTDDQRRRLERAAELKADLVEFALTPPFQRPLREHTRRCVHPELDAESQAIESVESLLFEHRYDDGSTVLDRFIARNRKLAEPDIELLGSWNDSVHGVFEVLEKQADQLLLNNLFDEMPYTVYSSAGAEAVEDVEPGSFLITRVLPIDAMWMLSGTQALFPVEHRAAMAQVVAQRSLEHPELVLRNPCKRRAALDAARSMHESFLECFGTDLLLVGGAQVSATYQQFVAFHTSRVTPEEDSATIAGQVVDSAEYDAMFGSVNSVAVSHHPESGIWFFADYDLVSDAFANPDLVRRQQKHRDAVRGYLRDESIPPWVFDTLRRE